MIVLIAELIAKLIKSCCQHRVACAATASFKYLLIFSSSAMKTSDLKTTSQPKSINESIQVPVLN